MPYDASFYDIFWGAFFAVGGGVVELLFTNCHFPGVSRQKSRDPAEESSRSPRDFKRKYLEGSRLMQ